MLLRGPRRDWEPVWLLLVLLELKQQVLVAKFVDSFQGSLPSRLGSAAAHERSHCYLYSTSAAPLGRSRSFHNNCRRDVWPSLAVEDIDHMFAHALVQTPPRTLYHVTCSTYGTQTRLNSTCCCVAAIEIQLATLSLLPDAEVCRL